MKDPNEFRQELEAAYQRIVAGFPDNRSFQLGFAEGIQFAHRLYIEEWNDKRNEEVYENSHRE